MQWKVCGLSNKLASDTVRWKEDKYALQQQHCGLALLKIVNLICPRKYDKKYVESIFLLSYLIEKLHSRLET